MLIICIKTSHREFHELSNVPPECVKRDHAVASALSQRRKWWPALYQRWDLALHSVLDAWLAAGGLRVCPARRCLKVALMLGQQWGCWSDIESISGLRLAGRTQRAPASRIAGLMLGQLLVLSLGWFSLAPAS